MKKWRLAGPIFLLVLCGALAGVAIPAALWLAGSPAEPAPGALRILPAPPLLTPEPAPPGSTRLPEQPASVAAPPAAAAPVGAAVESPPPSPLPANVPDSPPAQPATPLPAPPLAATSLVIPKLNLDAPVVEAPVANQTWQVSHLGQSVGHLAGTAKPGETGNVVLAGHVSLVDGQAGPFTRLSDLQPGDEIILLSGGRRMAYRVSNTQIVAPTAIEVTYPSSTGQEITLLTCTNWDSVNQRYAQRLVVHGVLADAP
ncbi:MAG: class D sortase [Chloroflexi bacterium]|nr:MAG: class D sortase [Chloroflexota bacterium]